VAVLNLIAGKRYWAVFGGRFKTASMNMKP